MRKVRHLPLIYFLFSSNSFSPFLSVLFTFLLHSCLFLRFFHPIFVSIPSSRSFFFFFLTCFFFGLLLNDYSSETRNRQIIRPDRFIDFSVRKENKTGKEKECAVFYESYASLWGARKRRDISLLYSCVLDLCFFFLLLSLFTFLPSFPSRFSILYFKYGHEFAHSSLTTWIFSLTKIEKRYLLYRFSLRKMQTEHRYQEINEE